MLAKRTIVDSELNNCRDREETCEVEVKGNRARSTVSLEIDDRRAAHCETRPQPGPVPKRRLGSSC